MPDYHKLTLNFTAKAWASVEWVSAHEDLNKTDVVNRAVQLYEFIARERKLGGELLIEKKDGSIHRILMV
jgi:hypothetical protein